MFFYDESIIIGAVQTYNGTTESFYFDRNIKGDVIGIFNSSGTKVASYVYDAWGNCTTKTIVVNNFSAYNPIRYRGYYYDRETGLYYLNARYYNPEWRRLISPTSVNTMNSQNINGLNLYAYAENDPINVVCAKYNFSAYSNNSYSNNIANWNILISAYGGMIIDCPEIPEWIQNIVGAIPDINDLGAYIFAKGFHKKFAYATAKTFRFPILGGTYSYFYKSTAGFGTLVGASFKSIVGDSARASTKSLIKSFGKGTLIAGGINFAFNFFENDFQIDGPMLIDTGIDTLIDMSSFTLAAGTMSVISAFALTYLGCSIPGGVVIFGVWALGMLFEDLIRSISGYDQ